MKEIRPYIIAEISANHNGNLENALQLIEDAAFAGATAVKFQTFTPESITVNSEIPYFIPSNSDLWKGMDLWSLMEKAQTPRDWFPILLTRAHSLDLDAFSTPYDEDALNFLVNMGIEVVKIASFDVANIPLLHAVAEKKLSVILSTGMSTEYEINQAVKILKPKCRDLILLKCTSSYPCKLEDLNLRGIKTLKEIYDVEVGFSDHSIGVFGASIARALGSTVFEKHIRLVGDGEGLDSEFSADKFEFRDYVESISNVDLCLGTSKLQPVPSESASMWEKPSVIALDNVLKGEIFTTNNIGIRRPSVGVSPFRFYDVLGKVCQENLIKGQGITEEHF